MTIQIKDLMNVCKKNKIIFLYIFNQLLISIL